MEQFYKRRKPKLRKAQPQKTEKLDITKRFSA